MDSRSINLHGRDDEPRCTYEKTKPRLTKQRLYKILGDKQGALWQMCKWRMSSNSDFVLTFYSMHIYNYLGDVPHKRTIFAINLYRLDNPSTGNNLWENERENLDDEKMLRDCVLVQFYPF